MKAEFFGQAGWPPPSQARPTRRSSTVPISSPWLDQWLARRRVDQQGEAVRLTSCTYLGVLSAEWSLGGQGDQESRPAMRLTEPATITTPNTYDKKAWESTVPRIRGSRTVVSDTW
jgi:hypothetical protein